MIAIKILFILIYQEELGDLRNNWIENISNNIIYFIAIFIREINNNI